MTRRAPAWIVGLMYLPFGLFSGFYVVALPLLLTARGLALDRVAIITSVVIIPTFSSFLLAPLLDCGVARRTWAILLTAIAAASLIAAVLLLDRAAHGAIAPLTVALFVGQLSAQLCSSCVGGMIPNLVAEKDTAAVSGWLNVANLGGVGVSGALSIMAVERLGAHLAAPLLGLMVAAPGLLIAFFGAELRVPRAFRATMRRLFPDLLAVSRTRSALIGLLIFVTPSATFAAQNLFSGLGRDFHAGDATTTWITGIGSSILCGIGCVIGGWLSNRFDRRLLFVGTGIVSAAATLSMAYGPRSPQVFVYGVGAYYVLAGINYAACSAAAFDIVGINNPLSATQYALLMASTNLAIETVTIGDGRGYAHFGARGLLVTDALFALITGTVMVVIIRLWGGTGREPQPPLTETISPGALPPRS